MSALRTATALLPLLALCSTAQAPGEAVPGDARQDLVATLAASGLTLDLDRGVLALPAEILIREDLLEYVLVQRNGAAHESLLLTSADPVLVNAALLALGQTPGTNASWKPVEPRPSDEELRAGAPFWDVTPPSGTTVLPYLAWREEDEVYFFRVEDLISNLATGRSMRRHGWVFLGSRFIEIETGEEVWAASQYGNLINLSFFEEGYTLLTPALPECVEQTIWAANAWLVPERGAPVTLILATRPLDGLPQGWADALPQAAAAAEATDGR